VPSRIRPPQRIEIVNPGQTTLVVADPPASAASPGVPGTIAWDADFFYVCIAADTWVRASLTSW
jgi:hypothetical protein